LGILFEREKFSFQNEVLISIIFSSNVKAIERVEKLTFSVAEDYQQGRDWNTMGFNIYTEKKLHYCSTLETRLFLNL
jgi:hypothetical protein